MMIPIAKIEVDKTTIQAAIRVIKSGQWLHGPFSKNFEEKFAKFSDVKFAASCSSGTTALFLALRSLGIQNRDEVIVPSFSFIATASCVSMCGATPKFVDVNPKNFTLDPNQIQKRISSKTKAIIPVHLFGHPADMKQINEIAKKNSIYVIEDAAQAHGAKYNGKRVGGLSDVACFSFYPSKNLTVCGDGGMITTNNKTIVEKVKILRNHGRKEKYVHHTLGYNFKLSEIQAEIGLVRLQKLEKNNRLRRIIAKKYSDELPENIIKPIEEKWAKHVYHQYSIQTKKRNDLKRFLQKEKIETAVYYPLPIHKQPMYKKFNKEKLPITENLSANILSLPMFPSLTEKEQNKVITAMKKFSKCELGN